MGRRGDQTPTYHFCAPYKRTEGAYAKEIADAYGLPPHPWQQQALNDWLALDEDGRLLNSLCLLPVPRQNGKTGVSDPRCSWGLISRGEIILYTAQEWQTARKAFDALRDKFGQSRDDPLAVYPELNAMVDHYTTSANQMVLQLNNGGKIEFRTRGRGDASGRGSTCDLLIIDEAQEYTEAQDSALSSLVSAAPHGSPQTIMMGTVPDPANPKGTPFRRARDSMHKSPDVGECISEWAVDEVPDPKDRDFWYRTNPSLGYQLILKAFLKDSKTMLPANFAREHLGYWPPQAGKEEPVINPGKWEECAVEQAPSGGADAFGVKFSQNGVNVAVASAIKVDDSVYVELIAQRPVSNGLEWLLKGMASTQNAVWAVDGKAGAHALCERARKSEDINDANFVEIKPGDAIASASTFLNAVNEQHIMWLKTIGEVLQQSVKTSIRRKIGTSGGWGFGGDNPTPTEACALAAWAAFNIKTTKTEVFF